MSDEVKPLDRIDAIGGATGYLLRLPPREHWIDQSQALQIVRQYADDVIVERLPLGVLLIQPKPRDFEVSDYIATE